MNDQKDIKITENAQGQGIKSDYLSYLFLKAQKLSSALYLVTEFLSDQEPLKWKLRDRSLDIVSEVENQINQISGNYCPLNDNSISIKINQILTLLDIVVLTSIVSEMNFNLIKDEYNSLLNRIKQITKSEQDFWDNLILDTAQNKLEKNLIKETGFVNKKIEGTNLDLSKRHNLSSRTFSHIEPNKTENDDKKNIRQDLIIELLKDKDWVSINDISKKITDCSTKTIQRELSSLVKKGTLRKEGEKRWSRYFLVA